MSSIAAAETLLSEEDLQYLIDKGHRYTAERSGGFVVVVIDEFKLADRYSLPHTNLLLKLPPNFPLARPDMFWTQPHVGLKGGGYPPQANVFDLTYRGVSWQRWSRHLGQDQWRAGRDTLRTFLKIIKRELQEGG